MTAVRDTGFAEFAAGLLAGVLDAIAGAEFDQARKRLEWQRAAALDDEAFARAHVSDEQLAAALAAAGSTADPQTLRLALAREQRGLLQTVLARGVPRVVVDHGRVSARLLLDLQQGSASGTTGPSLPGGPRAARLRATPVNARSPEFLRLQTQITGEVEVTFKTVSE